MSSTPTTPNSTLFADPNPGTSRRVGPVNSVLNNNIAKNGISQIRGQANAGSTGAGIPNHVSAVHVHADPSNKTDTVFSVSFPRQSDPRFNVGKVYVSGYKGNTSPQLVGTGDGTGPVKFSLPSTGEPVTVRVVASGNSGDADINTAPSAVSYLGLPAFGNYGVAAQSAPASLDNIKDGVSFLRKPVAVASIETGLYNPNFDIFAANTTTADGWTPAFETTGSGYSYSRSTSPWSTGSTAQAIANNAGAGGTSVASKPFTVKAGATYTITAHAKSTAANPGSMYIRICWYSADTDFSKAGAASEHDTFNASGPTVSNTYQSFTGTALAPAGALYARIALYNWSGSACTITFSGVSCTASTFDLDNTIVDGTSFVRVRGTGVTNNNIDLSKSGVLAKGSIPIVMTNGFTYTATTTSITIAWSGQAVYRADGTITTIGTGSQAFTGLGTGYTYNFYPYYDEASSTLKWVGNSDVSVPSLTGATFASASSQEVTTTTSAALPTNFSVECWMKVASSYAGAGGLTKATNQTGAISSANCVFNIEWSSGTLGALFRDSGGTNRVLAPTNLYNDGQWHHVMYIVTGSSSHSLYVDGLQISTASLSTSPSATAGYFRLDKAASNVIMTGTMSEVAFYNKALTALQVAAHYNAGYTLSQSAYEAAVSADGPLNWWKLTETVGTSAADTGSAGTNTGTYVNTPSLNQSATVLAAIGTPANAWDVKSLLVSQAQYLQGRIQLSSGGLVAATPSTGTSSGGSGGSTGGSGGGPNRF